MIITKIGEDLIELNEETLSPAIKYKLSNKIHLIKLNFKNPNEQLVWKIFKNFPQTKRFIIEETQDSSISHWNFIFKRYKEDTGNWKKFYVENSPNQPILNFFKRHNKILLNLNHLTDSAFKLMKSEFSSMLNIVEVIKGPIEFLKTNHDALTKWNGNYIVHSPQNEN